MNYLVEQAVDEDAYVNDLQIRMYKDLPDRLGLDSTLWNCFPRAYRNNTNDPNNGSSGYIPEVFYGSQYVAGDGTQNRGALFYQEGYVVSFFGERDSTKRMDSGYNNWPCELTFFVDLSILTPPGINNPTTQRIDSFVINTIKNYIEVCGCGFHVKETVRNIDKVLEMYSGSQRKKALTNNLQPFLAFKFVLELIYNPLLRTFPTPKPLNPMEKLIVLFIVDSPDRTGVTKVIPVGNGQFIYQEYAPSNTLTPVLVGTSTAYLAGKPVTYLTYDNQPDTLAINNSNYSIINGVWDRTEQGSPYGFNTGDFIGINFIDQV